MADESVCLHRDLFFRNCAALDRFFCHCRIVAISIGGKIFGICTIFRYIIAKSNTLYDALIWNAYGFALLLLAYFIFEFLTPVFKVDQEIARDNRAVGLLSMIVSISISYVIGASIR